MYHLTEQRREIVSVAYKVKQGHLSSCFSVLEILNVLYKKIMHFDPTHPDASDNDKLVLCKGHAALALYAVFSDIGVISKEQLYSFTQFDSILGEHPDRNKIPGVDISTGSLGHGFPTAVGMAIGLKAMGKNNRIYAVIGDGEANEGSIWEAAFVATERKLDNIVCIVDDNNSECHMPGLGPKFAAFGWEVKEIDGNDVKQLEDALQLKTDKPFFVWAHTKKGFGSKTMEEKPEVWHHKIITDSEYKQLMEELQ